MALEAKALKPLRAYEVGFSESDGAISINADAVTQRLNALLTILKAQEQDIDHLMRQPGCRCNGDA